MLLPKGTVMSLRIDHVTAGAATLPQGIAYIRQHMGIAMPAGGKHADMATHNCVVRVGDGIFLELLAIDPEAAAPPRPRWFAMDDREQRQRLAKRPQPVGWVVSTNDVAAVAAKSPVDLGKVLAMSRGTRAWQITVPDSGMMPFSGCVPAFIQWSEGPHPSAAMAFPGPTLERIILRHPQAEELRATLAALGVADLAEVTGENQDSPSIAFVFRLADGSSWTLNNL
jgi:hypothetical protein